MVKNKTTNFDDDFAVITAKEAEQSKQNAEKALRKKLSNENEVNFANNKVEEGTYENNTGKIIKLIPLDELYDAPTDWNKDIFPEMSNEELIELIFSIKENGLIHPISVWENPSEDGKYMILSGHNRKNAFKKIIELYGDINLKNGLIKDIYNIIPSIVYTKEELTTVKAQEIIIDSNYVQRKLNNKYTAKIIEKRWNLVSAKTDWSGRTRDKVSEALGLKGRQVQKYYTLETKCIDDVKKFFYNNFLSLNNALKFGLFSFEMQKWIIEEFKNILQNKSDAAKFVSKFNNSLKDKEDFQKLANENIDYATVSFKIPNNLISEFKKYTEEWIEKNMTGK